MFQFTRFASLNLYIQLKDDRVLSLCGFPHSDISGSKLDCQLPETFRRLPRPSSPVIAKASAMYAYSLDHIIGIRLISPSLTNVNNREINRNRQLYDKIALQFSYECNMITFHFKLTHFINLSLSIISFDIINWQSVKLNTSLLKWCNLSRSLLLSCHQIIILITRRIIQ